MRLLRAGNNLMAHYLSVRHTRPLSPLKSNTKDRDKNEILYFSSLIVKLPYM